MEAVPAEAAPVEVVPVEAAPVEVAADALGVVPAEAVSTVVARSAGSAWIRLTTWTTKRRPSSPPSSVSAAKFYRGV